MLSLNGKFSILFIGGGTTGCGRSRANPGITGGAYVLPDGVHPCGRGHALMAGPRREFAGI